MLYRLDAVDAYERNLVKQTNPQNTSSPATSTISCGNGREKEPLEGQLRDGSVGRDTRDVRADWEDQP
jgi:hypothetical protein